MPALAISISGCILRKFPAEDTWQTLQAFSAEHGLITLRQRLSRRTSGATNPMLDLFDDAELTLESSNQGQTWFLKEARILVRRTAIGTRYPALLQAGAIAALVARNSVPEESRAKVAALLQTALDALAAGHRPEAVYAKSLYCFARDEGYPVQQHWRQELPEEWREAARVLLHTPLAELSEEMLPRERAEALAKRLEHYLRGHTEILFE